VHDFKEGKGDHDVLLFIFPPRCTKHLLTSCIYPFLCISIDGGFQARLKVQYGKVRKFRPIYGCKENQGAIHKYINQVVAQSSDLVCDVSRFLMIRPRNIDR
jgi:hypothetical protein